MDPLSQHDTCLFVDQHGGPIPQKLVEREEQLDAFIFIPKDATVLELGARFGTVSCLISKILDDPKKHVAVEPDSTVIEALTKNRDGAKAQFEIFHGVISREPVQFEQAGYRSRTIVGSESPSQLVIVTLEQLEELYELKFDVMVADCEGCMEQFVDENDMSRFRMIFLEKDMGHLCDYGKVDEKLAELGFTMIRNHHNEVYRSVYVNMSYLPFTFGLTESSCGSIGLFGKLGYPSKNETNVDGYEGYSSLSLHAPSSVELDLKKPLEIRGVINSTSENPPAVVFLIDQKFIGLLNKTGEMTEAIHLDEGKHLLEIKSTTCAYAHTVWLYKEQN